MSGLLLLALGLITCCEAITPTEDLLLSLNPRDLIQSLNFDRLNDGEFDFGLCPLHLQMYLEQIQNPGGLLLNQNPWALKMLDASAKIPDGLMTSNLRFPGHMYECMDVSVDHLTFNGSLIPGFKGKYFNFYFFSIPDSPQERMPIILPGFGDSVPALPPGAMLKAGLCLPSSCQDEDISYIMAQLTEGKFWLIPAMSRWQDQEIVLSKEDKGFISLCAVILTCIVIGTSLEAWLNWKKAESEDTSLTQKFFLNFGLYNNTKRFLDTTPPKGDHISCLDGIRFISMTWVVLGHVLMQVLGELPTNSSLTLYRKFESFWFQPVDNALPSVDTFFMLSGLLVCYLMLKELDKTKGRINWPMMYLHRYLRLTGIYAFILFFMVSLWEHLGIGPGHSNRFEVDNCRKVAWQNMLYINNFFPDVYHPNDPDDPEYPCMGETWYLANDMQFFVVAPIIVFLIWKIKSLGLVVSGLLALASALVPAGLTYKYGWGAQSGLQGVVPDSEQEKDYFNWNYIKPWCRFSPYIVGILLGYLLHITKKQPFKMNRLVAIWGWLVAFGTGFAVIYGLNFPKRGEQPLSEAANIAYGGFHRLAWAMAVGWVVFACARGYGGWINTFLSWNAFKPLSRISFIIYLVHIRMETLVIGMYPSVISINVTLAVIFYLAVLGYSALLSAALFVLVELPWLNTEKFLFSFLLRKKS